MYWPELRQVVSAAGYKVTPILFGRFGREIAVWGRLPRCRELVEKYRGKVKIHTFEDAFLRSVLPGIGTPPIGITIDDLGVHFDCNYPSRLENILQTADLDDVDLIKRAREGRDFLAHYGLSKYNAIAQGEGRAPPPGYILVIDQVAGDASIKGGNASAQTFTDMLVAAIVENPDKTILIRTHPAVASGKKAGHFGDEDTSNKVILHSDPINPHDLLAHASKVYCVTSQMGFEAIMAGHRPVTFGVPFYAGWGLSEDRQATPRRTRHITADQMFAAAMLLYPFWYDRTRGAECTFEEAARQLFSESRHHHMGQNPTHVLGVKLWKRHLIAALFGACNKQIKFHSQEDEAIARAQKDGGHIVVWASQQSESIVAKCAKYNIRLTRLEDGFLRSTGLGAELTPASSFVLDDAGIHYDPSLPSRLENLISTSESLGSLAMKRAETLRQKIVTYGVTKYNLETMATLPELPDKNIILVPGQVEDDASILKGAGNVNTNLGLLKATRDQNPDAYIIYKPHPDVLAGLRTGGIPDLEAESYCDLVAVTHATTDLIESCNEVWTMTSLLGFEALLRGTKVTCLGVPFYAGWGLTTDLGPHCHRRRKRPPIEGLIHAALIDYPVYMDPVSGLPCTPELMVDRLARKELRKKPVLRILAKAQGFLAGHVLFWR